MAKKKGSRANRNWATVGGGVAGDFIGANVGYMLSGGNMYAAGLGGWAGMAGGAAAARRRYTVTHKMNARAARSPIGGRKGTGSSRKRRDSRGRFA